MIENRLSLWSLRGAVIHINHFSANVDEVYFPQLEIVGDIATTVERLTGRLKDGVLGRAATSTG